MFVYVFFLFVLTVHLASFPFDMFVSTSVGSYLNLCDVLPASYDYYNSQFCFEFFVSVAPSSFFALSLSLSFSHIFTLAAATAVDRTDRVDSSHTPPGRRKKEVEKSSVVRHSALKGAVGGGGLAHGC